MTKDLKLEILEKMSTLVTAGFGLVAALAWNEAIKKLFEMIFKSKPSGLVMMFGYAIAVTVIVVLVTVKLGRLVNRAKEELGRDNE